MSERTAHERHPGGNGQAGRPMTPAELERDLEDTRQEMNATLEELTGRFTPESIMHWAADYVQKSGTKEFAGNMSEDIRRNPMPVALTAIGIGWLVMNSRKPPETLEEREARLAEAAEKRKRKAERREKVAERKEQAKAQYEGSRQRMRESGERARESAEELRERGRLWATRASRTGSDLRHQTGRMFEEQPLMMGALGVALGALFGAAMPRMNAPPEARETREQMTGKAKETAGATAVKAAEQAEEKIRQAGQAATSSIEESERRAKEQAHEHEEPKRPGGPQPH